MNAIAAAIILSSVAAIAATNAPSAPSGGIGATVWVRENLEVARVAKRSPSDRAGLHVMDKIVEIDGKSTKGLTLSAAVSALRGPAGSRVTLKVRSVGAATAREVVLTRELLDAEKIEWKNEVVYTTKYGTSFVVEEGRPTKSLERTTRAR